MQFIKAAIYLLCFGASVTATILLARAYLERKSRLILWTSICFAGLGANNFVLFLDLVIFPEIDLMPIRQGIALVAVGVLIWGFVWEAT